MGEIAMACGMLATFLYIVATLPMLHKAVRTHDLASYSGANLFIANAGNVTQAIYVLTLPPGPMWVLHGFNTTVSALMLAWWLQCRRQRCGSNQQVTSMSAVKSARQAGETRSRLIISTELQGLMALVR